MYRIISDQKLLAMHFQLPSNFTYMDAVDDFIIIQTPRYLGIVVVLVTMLTATIYTILRPLFPTFNPQEPLTIPQKIPYFGHFLGLARVGITYYLEIRLVMRSMILTLPGASSNHR